MSEQRMDALATAERRRLGRAEVKRELRELSQEASLRRAAELIESPPEPLWTMRALDLVLACHRVGESRAGDWFVRARVNPTHRVGDGTLSRGALTPRERSRLAAVLREAADHIPVAHAEYARRRKVAA